MYLEPSFEKLNLEHPEEKRILVPINSLKMTVPSTAEEQICKKNDVIGQVYCLILALGGRNATKKTHKALLKQQYENFNASSSESLDSIFNRLQKLVSRLAIMVVWDNKPTFDTMGLDNLYNNFKIVEQKVKRTAAANNDDKNLAFLTTSSPSTSSKAVKMKNASEKAMCAINDAGFDWSDMAEDEIQANMALMAFTDSESQKEYHNGLLKTELEKVKEEKEGFEFKIAKFEKSSKDLDDLLASQGPRIQVLKLRTLVCDKESDNSKENTDDSLKQQHKTVTETSSVVKSLLKVDKDWKEKFFYPANHVREEEPKKLEK
ncbi:hypothetical protein Tco_1069246 [Tanacetum coccineum]|uniref:Uncharacterized protein n=1 Tax=Tanacetum coccineum TaxID=301880 RepID=A0ABQ5HJ44_9ASTR